MATNENPGSTKQRSGFLDGN